MARGDKDTRTDALLRRVKDHPVAAPVIVVAIVLAAAAVFISQVDDARRVFWPPENPPEVTNPPRTAPPDVPVPVKRVPEAPKETPEAPKTLPAPRTQSTVQNNDRIFVHCQRGVMPAVMPPEGHIYVLEAREQPEEIGYGLTDIFGRPGSEWKFTACDGGPAWAYRCELTNYSDDVLFNVSVPVHLTFRTPVPVSGQDKARKQGHITLDRDWVFNVPKLDPSPAPPYAFYVQNSCVQKFIQVRLPKHVVAEKGRKIPLIQSENNLFQPLNPVPFN